MSQKSQPLKHVYDSGGTGTPVILLHGFLATSAYWKRIRPYLMHAGYRVITIDLLGFGKAPKPSSLKYGYREHIDHIDASINSLDLEGPYILGGHSMGALLAMKFSRTHAHRIMSLILLHPPLYKSSEEAYKALRSTGLHYRFLLDSKLRSIGWAVLKALPIMLGRHGKIAREGSLRYVIETAQGLGDLIQVPVKTLLMLGAKDRPEYLVNIEQARLSDYVSIAVTNTTHHAPIMNPGLTSGHITQFLQRD